MADVSQWREQWSEQEWATLRLAPVWVLSALAGQVRFDEDERGAFWDAVTDAALRSTGPGRELLGTAAAERRWLLDAFELDSRPVVSGLLSVTRLLERMSPDTRDDVRASILRVGEGVGRARGHFGRRMTLQDEQTLLLVHQLLQTARETSGDNPLNSPAAI
ncbi:hypothetical protein GCM10022399_41880 [Terrabacter ginsenosidimutans]|uniref:Uncharacterized protein n=1 Tax=Terrabacter ginsenosidimutans TaxID=490575 RepID=A0ABP7EPX2_9MICO